MIHDEWIRNVHANRPDLSLERLERTRAQMNHAVRDCVVTGFEYMIPSINLPDPDDRHVVAAAIHFLAMRGGPLARCRSNANPADQFWRVHTLW